MGAAAGRSPAYWLSELLISKARGKRESSSARSTNHFKRWSFLQNVSRGHPPCWGWVPADEVTWSPDCTASAREMGSRRAKPLLCLCDTSVNEKVAWWHDSGAILAQEAAPSLWSLGVHFCPFPPCPWNPQ